MANPPESSAAVFPANVSHFVSLRHWDTGAICDTNLDSLPRRNPLLVKLQRKEKVKIFVKSLITDYIFIGTDLAAKTLVSTLTRKIVILEGRVSWLVLSCPSYWLGLGPWCWGLFSNKSRKVTDIRPKNSWWVSQNYIWFLARNSYSWLSPHVNS